MPAREIEQMALPQMVEHYTFDDYELDRQCPLRAD
jgi:hypothetical protein